MENNIKEMEEALLGLVFASKKINDQLSQIFILLDKSYFSTKENQETFSMFKTFYESGIKEFDISIVNKHINDHSLSKVITHDYLDNLLDKAGFLSSLNIYLTSINENNAKSKIKNLLEHSLKDIDQNSSNEIVESIRNSLYNIESHRISNEFQKVEDVAKKVIDNIFSGNKNISGLKTGFKKLDEITAGLQNGDLIILAARPSVGKTAFALNLAMNVLLHSDKSVAFFSLEMPSEQLIQRMLSAISFVNNYKFKEPTHLTKEDKDSIVIAYDKLKGKNFFIDDSGSIKLNEIIWKSKRLKEKNKLDLIIIDYMQLIPLEEKYSGNRQQEVSKISRSLKQLARELDIPIVALSQLNRRVEEREGKKPMMSDLRESGSIEQDADIIAFLYREDYYNYNREEGEKSNTNVTELNIAKHRNGPTGKIDFHFNTETGRFMNFDKDKQN